MYIGHGEDVAYAGSYSAGSIIEWYDSTPINEIEGATFTKRAGTNWIQKISLPAGTYWIQAYLNTPIVSAGEGYILIRFYVNDGVTETQERPPLFFNCNAQSINDRSTEPPVLSSGIFTIASTHDIYYKVDSSSGTTSSAGNRQSKSNFMMIRRLV
jgi:hypothetical protein